MEPQCRFCTHRPPSAAFSPRILESRYKSPVTKRRECELRRCNAKVGTDLKYEFNSRFYNTRPYNVDRVVNEIQKLKRNVPDLDQTKGRTDDIQQESLSELSSKVKINKLKDAHDSIMICLREIEKIKTFLEDENAWWKILKGRSVVCCQQKLPHLHGVLDGSPVTLMLLEEGTDEVPRRFETSMPKEKNGVAGFEKLGTSSKEFPSETKRSEQYTGNRKEPTDEYTDYYRIPHYSLDRKSALIEVTSHEPTQRYVKRIITSDQNIVASEFCSEVEEDRIDEQRTPKRSQMSKEILVPPRDTQNGRNIQITFEDALKPRETYSRENIESEKHTTSDFESNVDLSTKIPSRNVSNHSPKSKTIIEKSVGCFKKKLPTRIPKPQSRA